MMSNNEYKTIKENWDKYVLEEEPSRKSVPGLKRSMGTLLKKGPQRRGSSLKNVDDMLPHKEDEEDISAPPAAPGGLEEEDLNEGALIGLSIVPLIRGWNGVMKLLARSPGMSDETRAWAQGHYEASQKYVDFLDEWNQKYPWSYKVVATVLGSLDWAGVVAGKGAKAAADLAYSALEKTGKLKEPISAKSDEETPEITKKGKLSPQMSKAWQRAYAEKPTEPIGSKPPVRRPKKKRE